MAKSKVIEVLLAEDDDFDAELTIRALEEAAPNRKVLRVSDGAQALEYILRQGRYSQRDESLPKLVLLDLDMPNAGGLDVLRHLRENSATATLPVGIITASEKHTDFFNSQQLSAWDYIMKPVTAQQLTDLIRQLGL